MKTDTWLPPWHGALYAANNAHHRVHDDRFLALLRVKPNSTILDIGCGSGEFTRKVADLVPQGFVTGIDPQASMIEQARSRASHRQDFVLARAQDLGEILASSEFDLVYSRAVFQWIPVPEHAAILSRIRERLRPTGWFCLEMGGAGNIPRMVRMLDEASREVGGPTSPWTFPDPGTYMEMLEAAGFTVEGGQVGTVAQRRRFDEASLFGWLESQALQAYEHSMSADQGATFRRAVMARLSQVRRDDGSFDQTYVRLEARVKRA